MPETPSPIHVVVAAAECDGRIAVYEQHLPPGTSTPLHRHTAEDEVLRVSAGSVTARVGDVERRFAAGSVVLLPRGVAHRVANDASEPAHMLVVLVPGGFEQTLAATGGPDVDPDDQAALYAAAGVSLLPWRCPRPLG